MGNPGCVMSTREPSTALYVPYCHTDFCAFAFDRSKHWSLVPSLRRKWLASYAKSNAGPPIVVIVPAPDVVDVAASAIAVNADALATHDRDFSKVKALRVII